MNEVVLKWYEMELICFKILKPITQLQKKVWYKRRDIKQEWQKVDNYWSWGWVCGVHYSILSSYAWKISIKKRKFTKCFSGNIAFLIIATYHNTMKSRPGNRDVGNSTEAMGWTEKTLEMGWLFMSRTFMSIVKFVGWETNYTWPIKSRLYIYLKSTKSNPS